MWKVTKARNQRPHFKTRNDQHSPDAHKYWLLATNLYLLTASSPAPASRLSPYLYIYTWFLCSHQRIPWKIRTFASRARARALCCCLSLLHFDIINTFPIRRFGNKFPDSETNKNMEKVVRSLAPRVAPVERNVLNMVLYMEHHRGNVVAARGGRTRVRVCVLKVCVCEAIKRG